MPTAGLSTGKHSAHTDVLRVAEQGDLVDTPRDRYADGRSQRLRLRHDHGDVRRRRALRPRQWSRIALVSDTSAIHKWSLPRATTHTHTQTDQY
jgi:hypothetical protein